MAKRSLMAALRVLRVVLALLTLAITLLMAGCSSPEPTPTATPTRTATPVPTSTPRPTHTPTPQPINLVVLHTNDSVGYTDPCG